MRQYACAEITNKGQNVYINNHFLRGRTILQPKQLRKYIKYVCADIYRSMITCVVCGICPVSLH